MSSALRIAMGVVHGSHWAKPSMRVGTASGQAAQLTKVAKEKKVSPRIVCSMALSFVYLGATF
jgi:hypothetical protein